MNNRSVELFKQKFKEAEALLEKYKDKPHCLLPEEEGFVIALVAGEEMRFGPITVENGTFSMTLRTKRKMSVFWTGKKFQLVVLDDTTKKGLNSKVNNA